MEADYGFIFLANFQRELPIKCLLLENCRSQCKGFLGDALRRTTPPALGLEEAVAEERRAEAVITGASASSSSRSPRQQQRLEDDAAVAEVDMVPEEPPRPTYGAEKECKQPAAVVFPATAQAVGQESPLLVAAACGDDGEPPGEEATSVLSEPTEPPPIAAAMAATVAKAAADPAASVLLAQEQALLSRERSRQASEDMNMPEEPANTLRPPSSPSTDPWQPESATSDCGGEAAVPDGTAWPVRGDRPVGHHFPKSHFPKSDDGAAGESISEVLRAAAAYEEAYEEAARRPDVQAAEESATTNGRPATRRQAEQEEALPRAAASPRAATSLRASSTTSTSVLSQSASSPVEAAQTSAKTVHIPAMSEKETDSRLSTMLDRFFSDDQMWQQVEQQVVGPQQQQRRPHKDGGGLGDGAQALPGGGRIKFRVKVPQPYPGVQYRRSKNLEDRHQKYAKKGTIVTGVVEDSGEWLRVTDNEFLPMMVGNVKILQEYNEEPEVIIESTGRWWTCGPTLLRGDGGSHGGNQSEQLDAPRKGSNMELNLVDQGITNAEAARRGADDMPRGRHEGTQGPRLPGREGVAPPSAPEPPPPQAGTSANLQGPEDGSQKAQKLELLPVSIRIPPGTNLDSGTRLFSDPINPFSDD
eukprot:TRINITY_DN13544_c0_g1_i1.p1 TRINITY_DN13544_c0_g1~~TRINITY_DN13544_c0_g1_i1.p1  ORF type:complete len:644 (+),score=188.12 TRINITY_DN13544_c0_g1_i1:151-2082(+)